MAMVICGWVPPRTIQHEHAQGDRLLLLKNVQMGNESLSPHIKNDHYTQTKHGNKGISDNARIIT